MLALIGFWHNHPGGAAEPSEIDRATMRDLPPVRTGAQRLRCSLC